MSDMSTEQQKFLKEFEASLYAALKDDYTLPSAKKIAYKNAGSVYPDVYNRYRHAIQKASNGGVTMVNPKSISAVDPESAEIFNEIRVIMQAVHYAKPTAATRRLMSPRKTSKPKVIPTPPPPVQTVEQPVELKPIAVGPSITDFSQATLRLNVVEWAMTANGDDLWAILQLLKVK